jgi:hypothetical protein
MKRTVTYAKLHGGDAFIPGVGAFGNTLPSQSKTLGDLKMWWTSEGLEFSLVNKGTKHTGIFPQANLQLVVFGPEEKDSD